MANEERLVQTLFKFQVDEAALKRAVAGPELVQKSLARLALEVEKAEKELTKLQTSFDGLKGDDLDKARLKAAKLEEQIAKSRQQAEKLVSQFKEVPKALTIPPSVASQYGDLSKKVGLAGDIQSNLGSLRGITSMAGLGGVSGAIGGAGDFVALIEELPRLKTAVTGLPQVVGAAAQALGTSSTGLIAGLGIGALAVGGITLAVAAFNATIDESKKNLEAAIGAQKTYYDALLNKTTQQVQTEIEQRDRANKILQQQIAETQAAVERGRAQGLPDALNPLADSLDELKKQFNENDQAVIRLRQGLYAGAFAMNDAAKAAEQLTQAHLNQAKAAGDALRFQNDSLSMSTDAIKSRVEAIQSERLGLNASIKALQDSGDTSSEASKQIADWMAQVANLTEQEKWLVNFAQPLAQAREDEKKKIEDLTKASEDLVKAAESAAKAQETYNQKLADIDNEVGKRLADAVKERDKALAQAEADAAAARLEAGKEQADALAEAQQKANEDEKDAKREHRKTLAKIDKQFDRDSQQAIEDRDAVALDRATKARDDAKAEENDAYKQKLTDIDNALAKENQQIKKRYDDQIKVVDQRLTEQTNIAKQRYTEQEIAAIVYGNEQRAIARRNLDQQLKDLQNGLTVETQYKNKAHTAMMQGAKVYHDYLMALAASLKAQAVAGGTTNSGAGQGKTKPTPYAIGGSYRAGTLAHVNDAYPGQRENFNGVPFPAGEGLYMGLKSGRIGAGGGLNVTNVINGSGLNARQLQRAVTKGTEDAFERYVKVAYG